MSSLIEAIREAHADILAGEDPATVIQEVATAHGINPVLLTRKFTENHGDPAQVKARYDEGREAHSRIEENRKARVRAETQAMRRSLSYSW